MIDPGEIYRQSDQFHDALEAGDRGALERLKGAYRDAWQSLTDGLAALETARRRRKTHPDNNTYRKYEEDRLNALLEQIAEKLAGLGETAARETRARQEAGVTVAGEQVRQLTLLSTPEPQRGTVSAQWVRVPETALRSLIGFLSDGSPLDATLKRVAGDGAEKCGKALRDALIQGHNPRRTARVLEDAFKVAPAKSLLICRTESLRAHREAQHRHLDVNAADKGGVIAGWMWAASLDIRCCAACQAMHGTVHGPSERLQDHPNGRCQMIPLTARTRETLPAREAGRAEALLKEKELPILWAVFGSRDAAAAFQAGEVRLADFAGYRDSAQWGKSIYRRSVSQARAASIARN